MLARAAPALQFEHACKLGLEGTCRSGRVALQRRSFAGLAQEQEPRIASCKARSGRGLASLNAFGVGYGPLVAKYLQAPRASIMTVSATPSVSSLDMGRSSIRLNDVSWPRAGDVINIPQLFPTPGKVRS
jgi:hypothetical protein